MDRLTEWLLDVAGPIIRYRILAELLDDASISRSRLLEEVLATEEVKKWLGNLGCHKIHGSTDTHAENALAKCLEYGLTAKVPEFDEKAHKYCDIAPGGRFSSQTDRLVLLPFLVRAGYSGEEAVDKVLRECLSKLHRTAAANRYDFFRTPDESNRLPKPWADKRVYKDVFSPVTGQLPVPTCYEFYALCSYRTSNPRLRTMIDDVVYFVSQPEFQSITGSIYGWDEKKRQAWAGGEAFIARAVEPDRLIMFMELASPFESARASYWFKEGLRRLERFRTPRGSYRFHVEYLMERPNRYYLYRGAHMGLGENRRSRHALEIESTFRMLRIMKRMKSDN